MVRGDPSDRDTTVSNNQNGAEYKLTGKLLGEGAFGRVLEARQIVDTQGQPSNLKVALKYQFLESVDSEDIIEAEIEMQRRAAHKYCVSIVDVIKDVKFEKDSGVTCDSIVIVMECTRGADLQQVINGATMSENVVRTYFTQLIEGVAHCHSQRLCHRDLKPQNISFDYDTLALKILDFGEGKILDDPDNSNMTETMNRGSGFYRAPELLSTSDSGEYDAQVADIWSCGIILLIMMCHGYYSPDEGFKNLSEHNIATFWAMVNDQFFFSSTARDLINQMLVPEPKRRITIDGIKAHPWFNETVLSPAALQQEMTRVLKSVQEKDVLATNLVTSNIPSHAGFAERDVQIGGAASVEFESEDDEDSDMEESKELQEELERRRKQALQLHGSHLRAYEKKRREVQLAMAKAQDQEETFCEADDNSDDDDEGEEEKRNFSTTPPATNYDGVSLLSFLMSSDTSLSTTHKYAERACRGGNWDCFPRGEFEWKVQHQYFTALLSISSVTDMDTHMVTLSYLGMRDSANTSRTYFNKFRAHVLRKMKKHIHTEQSSMAP